MIGLHDACSFTDDNVRNMQRKVPGAVHAVTRKTVIQEPSTLRWGKAVMEGPSIPRQ